MTASPGGTTSPGGLESARRPEFVHRALGGAMVAGAVPAAIHPADLSFDAGPTRGDDFEIAGTFALPYRVPTWWSPEAIRSAQ